MDKNFNEEEVIKRIKQYHQENPILLYMKGEPRAPKCGFSAKAVEALSELNVPFAYIDVLSNPDIRAILPKFAQFPTFPQLWVNGELIGGSDIMVDMQQSGELAKLIESLDIEDDDECGCGCGHHH